MSEKKSEPLASDRAIEAAEKAGGWADTVFGEGFRQLGAAFADSMAGLRARNRLRVLQKTQKAIDDAGLTGATRPLNERMHLPLLEAISEESDEGLQDVWAAYIRSAVDPRKPNPDRVLIGVIRGLEPGDWPLLQKLFSAGCNGSPNQDFGMSDADLEQSLDRLTQLGLFDYDDPSSAYLVAGRHMDGRLSIKVGDAAYYGNKLLRKLADAVSSASGDLR